MPRVYPPKYPIRRRTQEFGMKPTSKFRAIVPPSNFQMDTMASGVVPKYGAIFMSSTQTRQECFDRKLFGLPGSHAQFVKHIKAGMILFLFDYNERQIYGVFEAVSDGEINIMPHAYSSSGKLFPAQVKFRVIWNCKPLLEDRFRGAIRENYYERYKFNFGLSKKQVGRLLTLFHSRKSNVQKTLNTRFGYKNARPTKSAESIELTAADETDTSQLKERELTVIDKTETSPLKERKTADISTSDPILGTEDYIPLSGPGSPESVEDCIPLSSPEFLEHLADKFLAEIGIHFEPSEDATEHYPRVNGLHCDKLDIEKNVFSRLDTKSEASDQQGKDGRQLGAVPGGALSSEKILESSFHQKEMGMIKKRKKRISVFERLEFRPVKMVRLV